MKKLRIICIIIAIIAAVGTGAYVIRNYINRDVTSPVIEMSKDEIHCKVGASQKQLLKGVTATDDKDGDLTDRVMINDIHINDNEKTKETEFDITYIVFDKANNSTSATRTLIYKNYHSPRFAITDELRFDSISTVDLYSLITAEDCIDGDITGQITIEMGKDYLNAISYGMYDCTVSVTNSLGDTSELPLSFEIYDATSEDEIKRAKIVPENYIVYLEKGEEFNAKKNLKSVIIGNIEYTLTASDAVDEEDTSEYYYGYYNEKRGCFMPVKKVHIDSNVNTKKAGTYDVTYSMKSPASGESCKTSIIVIVE